MEPGRYSFLTSSIRSSIALARIVHEWYSEKRLPFLQLCDMREISPSGVSKKATLRTFFSWSTRPDTSDTGQRHCIQGALTHPGRILPVFHILCRSFRLWHLHNWPCIWWQRGFPVTPIFLPCVSLLPSQKMFLISIIVIIMALSASPDTRLLCAT